jgi:hypothetical protein
MVSQRTGGSVRHMMDRRASRVATGSAALVALCATAFACNEILGLDAGEPFPPGWGGSAGQGGTGGNAGCTPPADRACYEGDPVTLDVGTCHGGTQSCEASGQWGACTGQQLPAAEICAAVGDEDCDGVPCSEAVWNALFGDASGQQIFGLAADPATGRIAAVGTFAGTVSFGGEPLTTTGGASDWDAFVAVFAADGTHLWSKSFGAADEQKAEAVVFDSAGQLWATGTFRGTTAFGGPALTARGAMDGFVVVLAGADGSYVHSLQIAETGATLTKSPRDIALSGTDVVVAGDYTGQWCTLGPAPCAASQATGAFVLKLASDGSTLWRAQIDSLGEQQAMAIAVDATGSVVLGGSFSQTLDPGGGNTLTTPNATTRHGFLSKLDGSTGLGQWSRTLGNGATTTDGWVQAVAVGPDGGVVIAGYTTGDIRFDSADIIAGTGAADGFVAKYSSTNVAQWRLALGQTGEPTNQEARAVAVDSQNNVVVAGSFEGVMNLGAGLASEGGRDVFLAKLDPDGTHLWSKGFGGTGEDVAYAMAVGAAEQVFIGGVASSDIDFGSGSLTCGCGGDAFMAA